MDTANLASFNNTSRSLLPPTLHPLQPRDMPFFPGLDWVRVIEENGLVLVVAFAALHCVACIALARLFTQILDNFITMWANSPPSNQVVLEWGNLRVEFGCSATPVPVAFIAEFAASRRNAAERGFAPVFAKEWWWERGARGRWRGRLCYAGLRVVEAGGVAIPPFG